MTTSEIEKTWMSFSGFVKMLGSVLGPFLLIATTTYGVAVAVSGVMANEVTDILKKATGQDASDEKLETLIVEVQALSMRIESANLPKMVADMAQVNRIVGEAHPPRVIDVDMARSGIFGPNGEPGICYPLQPCEARIFARRTPLGEPCDVPEVLNRRVLDINATPFPARRSLSTGTQGPPQAILGDFEWRSLFYEFGPNVPAGFAEYEMLLEFDCPGGSIRQPLPPLAFTVVYP